MKKLLVPALLMLLVMLMVGCEVAPQASQSAQAPSTETASAAEQSSETISTSAPANTASGSDATQDARKTVDILDQMPSKPLKIAVLAFQSNPYWFPVRDGSLYAKKLLAEKNCTVDWIVVAETMDAAKMCNAIDTCIVEEYSGIICCAFEDSIVAAIDRAVAAGIPVFTMDSDPGKKSGRTTFFGQDYYKSGEMSAQYIGDTCKGKGKVGIITGAFGASCPEARAKGFKDYMAAHYPEMDIIGVYENKDNAERAYDLTKDMLTADQDLAGLYVNAGGPFGAAKALTELKKTDSVTMVCHDFIEENYSCIGNGSVDAIVGEDPFQIGFDPVASMYNYLVSGQKPEEFHYTHMVTLTKDNLEEITKLLK